MGRQHVAILKKATVDEPASDIQGLLYIQFEERVDEVANKLFLALKSAGYEPSTAGLS